SRRLPGKVLKDIAGKPMLAWVIERAGLAERVDQVVLATSTNPDDDPVAQFCEQRNYTCCRGSLDDVLDRLYRAARQYEADTVVRLTADCPLIDPGLIDETVAAFMESQVDFAANRLPPPWKRTYPIGLDTEVCSIEALERAWQEADQPYQREHVMPYLYEEPGRFTIKVIHHEPDYGRYRWTVDTHEDLDLVRRIFAELPDHANFSWLDIIALFEAHPELAEINSHIRHKGHGQK
ncbi:MAG: glycosyltransferase family protein, partial [Anaerolineales bacterium]|nr:glycosyltransferase family protein [Anaerolineales bacterium]